MCEKMFATNLTTIVELSHWSDGHFEQLFVAHVVSFQGFVVGCWPIITIDPTRMSGLYEGSLFLATMYNAKGLNVPFSLWSDELRKLWGFVLFLAKLEESYWR